MRYARRLALLTLTAAIAVALAAPTASAAWVEAIDGNDDPYIGGVDFGLSPGETLTLAGADRTCTAFDSSAAILDQDAGKVTGELQSGSSTQCDWLDYATCTVSLYQTPTGIRFQQDPNGTDGEIEMVVEDLMIATECGGVPCSWEGTVYGKVTNPGTAPTEVTFPNPNRSGASTMQFAWGSSWWCESEIDLETKLRATQPGTLALQAKSEGFVVEEGGSPVSGWFDLELAPTTDLVFDHSSFTDTCSAFDATGQITWQDGIAPLGELASGTLTCDPGTYACSFSLESTPYDLYFQQDPNAARGEAELAIEGLVLKRQCSGVSTCEWSGTIYGQVTDVGTSPIEVQFPNPNRPGASTMEQISGGSTLCGSTGTLTATIQFADPADDWKLVEFPS